MERSGFVSRSKEEIMGPILLHGKKKASYCYSNTTTSFHMVYVTVFCGFDHLNVLLELYFSLIFPLVF